MPYSDFTVREVRRRFDLRTVPAGVSFAGIPATPVSATLTDALDEYVPLAQALGNEKARSEFIVAPVLMEVRRHLDRRVGLYSGVDFNVDPARGLNGTCDFLLGRSPDVLVVESPLVAVVEAKSGEIRFGMGQCMASMVAVRLYNEQSGQALPAVYGTVTTGSAWQFMRLAGDEIAVDPIEYPINTPGRVVAILAAMLRGDAP